MTSADVVLRPIADDDWDRVFEIFSCGRVRRRDLRLSGRSVVRGGARTLGRGTTGRTVVALRDDVILGTAKFGPNRPARGSHVATASFMVARDARGSGVGRAMCEYVIALRRSEGYAAMQFNAVVSTNVHAIELYRQLGFVTIGTVPRRVRTRDAGTRRPRHHVPAVVTISSRCRQHGDE